MNLAQLRAFVAVADEGSFTSGAAVLGLTQSGASHAVASLERELGVRLLSRATFGVRLTVQGEHLIGHAREAVRRVDRIAADAAALVGQHRGRLRVAGFPSTAQLLPALVGEFRRRLPDVSVVLLEGSDEEVRRCLADGVIDAGVVADLEKPAASRHAGAGAVLAHDNMVAVLDPQHPLAGQPEVALADLSDDEFLMSDGGCEPLLRLMYEAAGVELRPARRIRDMPTLLALVRERLGVTVVPTLALSRLDGVVAVPVTPAARRTLRLVPADEDDVPATVQLLLDIARTTAPLTTTPGTTPRATVADGAAMTPAVPARSRKDNESLGT